MRRTSLLWHCCCWILVYTSIFATAQNEERRDLLDWLIGESRSSRPPAETNGVDGFFNNPFRPELGAVDTVLLRRSRAQYADGVSKPGGQGRPNPLTISDTLMKGADSATTSKTGKTVLLVFFGQQLADELLDTHRPACPPEHINIPISESHHYRNETGLHNLPLLRTRYDPRTGHGCNNARQQLNGVTPFIDGNLIYGTSSAWTDALRHFSNGSLAPHGQLAWSDPEGLFPEINTVDLPMINSPPPRHHGLFKQRLQTFPASRLFMLGNPRGNENPMLLSLGIVWYRWHNLIAKYLTRIHEKDWTDDRIFNEAKKWVVATYQHIAVNHWLPQWIGERLPAYSGYNAAVDPQVDQLFQVAAMRFGHTLVPSGIYLRNYGRNGCKPVSSTSHYAAVRTCNSYWNAQDDLMKNETGGYLHVDELLMGMASQLAEREDHMIVEDLRGYVYGPLEFPRRDLMAISIQRARDHGAPDYNTARKSVGLHPIESFASFADQTKTTVHQHDPQVLQRFAELYQNTTIDDVDLWVGGLLETAYGPGELFRAVLKDQFSRIRSGDRFWYANLDNNLFTAEEVERLEQLTFYDVITAVTRMDADDLQKNPFLSPSEDIPGQSLAATCMEAMVRTDCVLVGPDHQPNGTFNCRSLPQPGTAQIPLEPCTPASTFSYFETSRVSFVVIVMLEILVVIVVGLVVLGLLHRRKKQLRADTKARWKEQMTEQGKRMRPSCFSEFTVHEWVGKKEGLRMVNLLFNSTAKMVEISDRNLKLVRTIDLSRGRPFDLWLSSNGLVAVLKLPKEYDLVLKFDNPKHCDQFLLIWQKFLKDSGLRPLDRHPRNRLSEKNLLSHAVTARMRRKQLQKFFRSVLSHALSISHQKEPQTPSNSTILFTELTREEFANELRMTSDAAFVNKMFELVDKDNNGSISFREFLDLLVVFRQGTPEEKLAFIFSIYDTQRKGKMTLPEFTTMIRSLVSLSKAQINEAHVTSMVESMTCSMKLNTPDVVTLEEFQVMMSQHRDTLDGMQLAFAGLDGSVEIRRHPQGPSSRYHLARQTFMDIYKDPDTDSAGPSIRNMNADIQEAPVELRQTEELAGDKFVSEEPMSSPGFGDWLETWSRRLDYWRLEAFWLSLFTVMVLAVFAERAYTYRVEKEHVGFRMVTGWGVPITRGAASGMMLSFSVVLLTTCRHITTWLRETPVHHYVPFDSIFSLHQYAAWWGIFFAVLHTIGHGFNFYHISTQPISTLACLLPECAFSSHELPGYHHWVWSTATGVTGVLLWVQTVVISFFSLPSIRRRLFVAFWLTHNLYPIFYALLLLHGASRLVQEPHFPYYLAGPAAVFSINFMISLSRRRVQVCVVHAELLPSDVTKLVIRRPVDFKFRSGQWVRLACPSLGDEVYHPFTLSSAPQEPDLSVHIRAVGPWTRRMREAIQQSIQRRTALPKLFMDGPYGEGHQEWRKYPIVVLIGAGIGVTPFSSILQDMAARISAARNQQPFRCQKVYFLWVTRDQKQFEWMVDLLRLVESKDINNLISPHIFITQFFTKFDIRTLMLYVCERHFQKIERRSLFTGLRAVTHFGHPNFYQILKNVGKIHDDVEKIGVFSCGTHSLSRSVDSACRTVNGETPIDFHHHYEIY